MSRGLSVSIETSLVRFSGTKRTVVDGAFAETKEMIARLRKQMSRKQ